MREVHTGWLWAGVAACAVSATLVHTLQLWVTDAPLLMILEVAVWFAMSSASVLTVLALRLGILVVPPGSATRARAILLGTLAAALGLAAVLATATRNAVLYSAETPTGVSFASLVTDALLGLLIATAGTLLALTTLMLLLSVRAPRAAATDLLPSGPEPTTDRAHE